MSGLSSSVWGTGGGDEMSEVGNGAGVGAGMAAAAPVAANRRRSELDYQDEDAYNDGRYDSGAVCEFSRFSSRSALSQGLPSFVAS